MPIPSVSRKVLQIKAGCRNDLVKSSVGFQIWQTSTDIVADHTTIISPNKVGILPPNTVQKQPYYLWWIASGYHDTRSVFTSNAGGIFLIDMGALQWSKSSF